MTETNFAATPRLVGGLLRRVFSARVGSLDTSSNALANLATATPRLPLDGRYFDRTDVTDARSSELSYNEQNARELWRFSAAVTRLGL
ncbi:hypothetical protein [Glaciihabitans sp. UYNi722]|uniref:hypothetical protein n=1 Tax=Glaciihabitans sp. UYNi722 TaxID=3156344 RepID=UPI00339A114E